MWERHFELLAIKITMMMPDVEKKICKTSDSIKNDLAEYEKAKAYTKTWKGTLGGSVPRVTSEQRSIVLRQTAKLHDGTMLATGQKYTEIK